MAKRSDTYAIPFQYVCEKGHDIGSNHAFERCPLTFCGAPLTRVGKGSRGPRKATAQRAKGDAGLGTVLFLAYALAVLFLLLALGVIG